MTQRFTNNARTTLASFLSDSATSLTVAAGDGDQFPEAGATTASGDDWFKLVLQDDTGEIEIVHVNTRTAGSDLFSDVVRGREGTVARAWDSGETIVALRMTAADLESAIANTYWDIPESNPTASGGNKTIIKVDVGHHVDMDGGTVTVPAGIFAKGDVVVVCNNGGSARNLIQGSGATVRWIDSLTGNRVIQPWGLVTLFCVTPDVFIVTGQGLE